jgi:hypothetical protein
MDSKPEISQKIKFSDLSKTLDKIANATLAKKPGILKKFIDDFNKLAKFLKDQTPDAVRRAWFPVQSL